MIDKVIDIDASDLADRLAVVGTETTGLLVSSVRSLVSVDSLVFTGGGGTEGGAVLNRGDLSMRRCVVRGNHAGLNPDNTGGWGGGIANYGVLSISGCTIENNSSDPWSAAGGVFNGGLMFAEDCRISGNEGGDFGAGGIYNLGSMTIVGCTIGFNSAESNIPGRGGGGILNYGSCSIRNTSVVGNSAGFGPGGGVDNKGEMTLYNCTLGSNFSKQGWAIRNEGTIALNHSTVSGYPFDYGVRPNALSNSGGLTLINSIVAAASSYAGPDIHNQGGAINLDGSNFVGDPTDSGLVAGSALLTGDPMLATLGDYGGATPTMPPLPGSGIIDAAVLLPSTPNSDQRGVARPQGVAPDLGSVELEIP